MQVSCQLFYMENEVFLRSGLYCNMTFYLEIPKKSCTFASMKREVYESQKAFAGDKKPSMQRRCVGHDYTERMMYMVTMTTEGRRPLFGTVVGRSEAPEDSAEAPRVELTELGRRVEACWHEIPVRYPQIKVIALQMMPDPWEHHNEHLTIRRNQCLAMNDLAKRICEGK